MKPPRARVDLRDSSGQAAVLTVVWLTALLGMAAFVIDVGSWFTVRREAQSAADAAALAGAQALPTDPAAAGGTALDYASRNRIPIDADGVAVSSGLAPNDTISVRVARSAPAYFSRIFGISSVATGATATARVANMSAATGVAPIVVRSTNPLLAGAGCPCFGQATTLTLQKNGAPGAFDIVDFDTTAGGTTGTSAVSDWILHGYSGYLPLGMYFSDSGARWNSSSIQNALAQRLGSDLLLPVYDTLTGTGSTAAYHTIGWVGFHLTGTDAGGSSGHIYGHFTRVIWQGIQSTSASPSTNYGAYAVQLVN